ncbi:MAG TPA: tail fiber domain-containing protein, partial [Chthoniobacterales bacterium]
VQALNNSTTGQFNIAIGALAGFNLTTGDNNIDIGNAGVAGETNTIRIGGDTGYGSSQTATFIAGIFGATTSDLGSTTPVVIDANGNLGTVASSERFKTEIHPMDDASKIILSLQPITFRYKNDSKAVPQFGLAAEEVAKLNPNLVVRDAKGDIYSVRYEAVNAMLLNEFLKEHKKVEELEATVAQLKSTVAAQQKDFTAQLKELDSKIQTVNDKVELSKPAPQTVGNH